MTKVSKALTEVWEWKEEIYEERKGMTLTEWAKISKEKSSRIRKKYGIGKERETAGHKKVVGA
jgi:hypothetical protein